MVSTARELMELTSTSTLRDEPEALYYGRGHISS
jgi:hypothetical protein